MLYKNLPYLDGAYPCHGTCRGTLSDAPPPLRVMVARPAQVTQVTQVPITLTQHDTAAAPCDTTHPMWRHRGTARPSPPHRRHGWVSSDCYDFDDGKVAAAKVAQNDAEIPLRKAKQKASQKGKKGIVALEQGAHGPDSLIDATWL